ncbi:hypothetical protein [Ralstonia chuxiongensis]|uniref:Uncharacterized protein n=1 Tax=Ralstonia chuxiongensis TaxID=2957504 RepID=A0AA41WX48_9RALS|nr:hypothetical protein [Ralstonia chuxiongensis]MCP1174907.1 hypothetical protein [Ralstonia chuxiongensis]
MLKNSTLGCYLLTGDAGHTDPVCDKTPDHEALQQVVLHSRVAVLNAVGPGKALHEVPLVFRSDATTRRRSEPLHSERRSE